MPRSSGRIQLPGRLVAAMPPLVLALLIALAAPTASRPAEPAAAAAEAPRALHAIPFELYDNRIYVQVSGPGFAPSWFIVDTGAQVTHYTSELVAQAQLRTSGGVGISGTGTEEVRGAWVAPVTLSIGTLALPVGRGVSAPADALFGDIFRGTGRTFEGVIGYDLFAAYAVEIDYEHRLLRLYPRRAPAPSGGATIPLRLIDRKPSFETFLTVGGERVSALIHLDTGFGGAVSLNARFVAANHLLERAGTLLPGWNRGVGGITEARTARIDALQLGSLAIARPITGMALVQGEGVRSDSAGRIGGALLRRFTVRLDYAARTLVLVPNGRFGEPFETDMSGLSLTQEGDAVLIWRVAPGTPAAEAGVQDGDRLLAIDGRPVSALTLEAVRALLRREGEQLRLGLARGGTQIEARLTLRRRL